ncbi:RND family transporter [candidate division CSSED10-310 bacterium]|uniref:RND family transporter n=1 Tax=candidate division CSSED10-310 bacterium TaxID=2855610 RepID=A0ABV6YRC0_UNCC1
MTLKSDQTGTVMTTWGLTAYTRPVATLSLFLLIAALAGLLALRIRIETDILKMLPTDSPLVQDMLVTLENFKSFDRLYLIVSAPQIDGEVDTTMLEEWADTFSGQLVSSNLIQKVTCKRDFEQIDQFLDYILPRFSRYIPPQKLPALLDKLSPAAIDEAFRKARLLLLSQPSTQLKNLIQRDPLGLIDTGSDLFAHLSVLSEFSGLDPEQEYFFSKQGQELLMIVDPTFPPQDVEKSRALMQVIAETIKDTSRQWQQGTAPIVKIAGGPAIAVSDEKQIRRDIQITLVTSLVGVLLFFQLAFRNWLSPIIVSFPLFLGIVDTLGFASLTLGRLNLLSSIFAVILVGLGIDFSIHLYHRYLSECALGKSSREAMTVTYAETGRSIMGGALTTATAFLAIMITDFRGLRELGLIAGFGILFTFINVCSLFPVIIYFYERFFGARISPKPASHRWAALEKRLYKHHRLVIGFCMFLSGVFLYLLLAGGGITFESDLAQLRPAESPVWTLQQEVTVKFLWQGEPLMVIFRGQQLEQVMPQVYDVDRILSKLQQQGLLDDFVSLATLYPAPERLRKNLAQLQKIDLPQLQQTFHQALAANGFRVAAFQPALNSIITLLSSPPANNLDNLKAALGPEIVASFYNHSPSELTVVTYLFIRPGPEREKRVLLLSKQLGQLAPQVSVTGMQRIISEFKKIIRHDFFYATAGAALAVICLLLLYFRHPTYVLLALVPISLGILWTLSIMKLVGLNLNFLNVVVTPMLIGIGIDDGIHIVHHYLKHRQPSQKSLTATSFCQNHTLLSVPGKGIVLTSLTTMISFGSLSMAHYPGLQWIGILSVIGVGLCLIFSVLLLPALIFCWASISAKK